VFQVGEAAAAVVMVASVIPSVRLVNSLWLVVWCTATRVLCNANQVGKMLIMGHNT